MRVQRSWFSQSAERLEGQGVWGGTMWRRLIAVGLTGTAMILALLLLGRALVSPATDTGAIDAASPAPAAVGSQAGGSAGSARTGEAYIEYISPRPTSASAGGPDMSIIGTGSVYDERLFEVPRRPAQSGPSTLDVEAPAGADLNELPNGFSDYIRSDS